MGKLTIMLLLHKNPYKSFHNFSCDCPIFFKLQTNITVRATTSPYTGGCDADQMN